MDFAGTLFVIPAAVMVFLVAALHVYILVLEMFWWRTPRGLRSFGMTQEVADSSAKLAANQGLYNGSPVGTVRLRRCQRSGDPDVLLALRDRRGRLRRRDSESANHAHPIGARRNRSHPRVAFVEDDY